MMSSWRPRLILRDRLADLAGHELRAAARRLVVEEDARGGVHAVGLAVVDRHVVAVDLAHAVGRARPEQGVLRLGHLLHLAEHLRARRLVEPDPARVVPRVEAYGLEHVEHTHARHVAGDERVLPGVGDERDRAQVVDLGRVGVAHRAHQAGQVGEVTVVQPDVGDELGHELAPRVVLAADQAVDVVPLLEQQLGEVEAVLAGDSGDESAGHARILSGAPIVRVAA